MRIRVLVIEIKYYLFQFKKKLISLTSPSSMIKAFEYLITQTTNESKTMLSKAKNLNGASLQFSFKQIHSLAEIDSKTNCSTRTNAQSS